MTCITAELYLPTRYVYVADSQTEGAGEGLWVKTDIKVGRHFQLCICVFLVFCIFVFLCFYGSRLSFDHLRALSYEHKVKEVFQVGQIAAVFNGLRQRDLPGVKSGAKTWSDYRIR